MTHDECTLGRTVYYNRQPMKITRTDIPGEYGPRVAVGVIITTPELDHRLTATADESFPPSLSDCMWGKSNA